MTELRTRHGLQPLDTPGYARRRKCKVNLDDLDWDRPDILRESRKRGASPALFNWTIQVLSCLVRI